MADDLLNRVRLARDLIAAAERRNRSQDATLVVPADYLEVVATKQ